jgi:hypothetical protein
VSTFPVFGVLRVVVSDALGPVGKSRHSGGDDMIQVKGHSTICNGLIPGVDDSMVRCGYLVYHHAHIGIGSAKVKP